MKILEIWQELSALVGLRAKHGAKSAAGSAGGTSAGVQGQGRLSLTVQFTPFSKDVELESALGSLKSAEGNAVGSQLLSEAQATLLAKQGASTCAFPCSDTVSSVLAAALGDLMVLCTFGLQKQGHQQKIFTCTTK